MNTERERGITIIGAGSGVGTIAAHAVALAKTTSIEIAVLEEEIKETIEITNTYKHLKLDQNLILRTYEHPNPATRNYKKRKR